MGVARMGSVVMSQKAPLGLRVMMSMAWTTLQLQFSHSLGEELMPPTEASSWPAVPAGLVRCQVGSITRASFFFLPEPQLLSLVHSTSKDSVQSTGPSPGLHILAWHRGPTMLHHDPPVQL